jgi:hypothetical protein
VRGETVIAAAENLHKTGKAQPEQMFSAHLQKLTYLPY